MKVIVAGSRSIRDLTHVVRAMSHAGYEAGIPLQIVSGGAPGVDKLGEVWATMHKVPVCVMPANWAAWGKAAGYHRNIKMAQHADALVAVWDGHSPGTAHMIRTMRGMQKPVFVHLVGGE